MTPDERARWIGEWITNVIFEQHAQDREEIDKLCQHLDRTNELLERLVDKPGVLDPYIQQAKANYRRSRGHPVVIHAHDCTCGRCEET